jgi:hypothetical protein
MKKSFKSLIVYILIIYFVLSLSAEIIKLPSNFTYLILTLLILAFTIMISCPLLSFLTVKCKFPTFFLMTFVLLVGVFYALKLFMIDLYINEFTFEGVNLGFMQVESFDVIPIISIVVLSFSTSLLGTVYRELDN